ncbi:MAG: rRNA maturation RNase YbeY [Proteobacteria bacterium]|nr:rRNA maturation RNase YbeY [Pseudomonadota bacterium]
MAKPFVVDVTIDPAVVNKISDQLIRALETVTQLAGRKIDAPQDATEISLFVTNDKHVRQLNNTYRNQDRPTNVLSFTARENDLTLPQEAPLLLGDVVLGYETIAKEAKRHGKTLADHMCHLTVHGVLHLAGFDHDTDKAAEKMRGIEIDVLAAAGISNPYTNWLDGPE